MIEIALQQDKEIRELTRQDFVVDPRGEYLIKQYPDNIRALLREVYSRLVSKVESGLHLPAYVSILHTGPHHDDVMLSYHPLMKQLLKDNKNQFIYLTSGFNSVTNGYMQNTLADAVRLGLEKSAPVVMNSDYESLLQTYVKAANQKHQELMTQTEAMLMLKNISRSFDVQTPDELVHKTYWLKQVYFPNRHPGEKDIPEVQVLKGAMRESESERMLLMAGVPLSNIDHMRAKFYTGDYFNPMPSIEKDAQPMIEHYRKVKPQIITVALDPEGTGPDTHYKVLQVVAQALKLTDWSSVTSVWGYRNVWHRFKYSDANLMFPITDEEMENMNHAFLSCFSTQKTASFPPTNYDGPFSGLAEKIQRNQYEDLKTLLGENYFKMHPNPRLRQAKGFIFIKEMDPRQFFGQAQELKSRIELM